MRAPSSTGLLASFALLSVSNTAAAAAPGESPDDAIVAPRLVVTATRSPEDASVSVQHVEVLPVSPALRPLAAPADDLLRESAAFSLFRRSTSATVNPSSAGATLRGIGPSAASRSLVLLDGIPLNDAFGGWVPWASVDTRDLERIEIVRGGGSGAWGNGALGGTLQLLSRAQIPDEFEAEGQIGSFNTRAAALHVSKHASLGAFRLAAGWQQSDGDFLVAAPGTIDRTAWSRAKRASASWSYATPTGWNTRVAFRHGEEERGNGTVLQANGNRTDAVSASAEKATPDGERWSASVWFQNLGFHSFFSAVNAARTAETASSNQYSVPASAAGASLVWSQTRTASTYSLGGDVRWVTGETRELYSFSNTSRSFTRQRFSGGDQAFAGLFASSSFSLSPSLRASVLARGDLTEDRSGHRRELNLADNAALLRNDSFANRSRFEFSPSANLAWTIHPTWRATLSSYQAFRLPTLNERFRPFRVGSVITEANPDLRTEHLTGVEAATEVGNERAGLRAGVFWNQLDDAVANVTVAKGPGTFPLFGTLPAGTLGRQKRNLDRLVIPGLELSAHWNPTPTLRLALDYVGNDGTVNKAALAPGLVGKRLAEVARHTVTASVSWTAPSHTSLRLRTRAQSDQFDDDENTLRLRSAATVDFSLVQPLGRHAVLSLAVDNLLDAQVATGIPADGVTSVAPSRSLQLGLTWSW